MTPQYCSLSGLPHSHTVTTDNLDAKYLSPMPQKGFLWNMQTLTGQWHLPPLLPSLSLYVTSAPSEMEAPRPCSEVTEQSYFIFEICYLEPSKMLWPTQWVTTETQLHLHYTEVHCPHLQVKTAALSCYKTCQKPTQMTSEEKSGDLQDKEDKIKSL